MSAEDDRPTIRYEDLIRRRGTVALREEDVLQMLHLGGQGYHLHTLHADQERQAVVLVVVHPDLQPVHPTTLPPSLNGRAVLGVQFKVIDGAVWERSKLTIEQAHAADIAEVAATQLRAVAEFRIGYNPDWLQCPDPDCPAPTVPVPEEEDDLRLARVLQVALQHRQTYHGQPPGVPG